MTKNLGKATTRRHPHNGAEIGILQKVLLGCSVKIVRDDGLKKFKGICVKC